MARGQSQASDKQLNTTDSTAAGYRGTASGELGPLEAGAHDLINSPGYDPATLSAITNAGIGGVNSAFGSAGGQIKRDAAMNKNPAGTAANLDTLAMDKGIAGGKEAGDIQMQNANFKASQRAQGLQMLQGLYGTNTGASTSLMGDASGILGARAAGPSVYDGLKAVGSVLQGVGGIVSAKG